MLLLVLFAIRVAVLVQGYLARYAPSNAVIARVRAARPRWRVVGGLWVLAWLLAGFAHLLLLAIAAGAPAWLNLIAAISAWDSIKFGLLGWLVLFGCLPATGRRLWSSARRARSVSSTPRHDEAGPARPSLVAR